MHTKQMIYTYRVCVCGSTQTLDFNYSVSYIYISSVNLYVKNRELVYFIWTHIYMPNTYEYKSYREQVIFIFTYLHVYLLSSSSVSNCKAFIDCVIKQYKVVSQKLSMYQEKWQVNDLW